MLSELRTIREGTNRMPQLVDDVSHLKEDIAEVKADVSAIRDAVKDHAVRIIRLADRVRD